MNSPYQNPTDAYPDEDDGISLAQVVDFLRISRHREQHFTKA